MKRLKRTTRTQRRTLGAVMAETVLVMPFIMLSLILIVYLGWNFRRLSQVTNMDRYVVWGEVTPGATGPGLGDSGQMNEAFFGLNGDQAVTISGLGDDAGYLPEGHRRLRDGQSDETYAYYDDFLERNPSGLRQRHDTTHRQSVNADLLGLSDLTRNGDGHSRLDGDWRYAREVFRYNGRWIYGTGDLDREEPRTAANPDGDPRPSIIDDEPGDGHDLSYFHVSKALSLNEVFFIELDEGLRPYQNNGNLLARNIREFYLAYPEYRSPDIRDPAPNSGRDGTNTFLGSGTGEGP